MKPTTTMTIITQVTKPITKSSSLKRFIWRLWFLADNFAVSEDCSLYARGASFLGYALNNAIVVAVLVVWSLPEDEVEVLALLALIEVGLINFGYVDGDANHFVFGLLTKVKMDRLGWS